MRHKRMRRFFILLFILLAPTALAAPCDYYGKDRSTPPLHRGINLSSWWEQGVQRPVSARELQGLRRLGFDFVRLPISQIYIEKGDAETLSHIRCSVASILNNGLSVVVDLHSPAAVQKVLFSNKQDAIAAALTQLWSSLAGALQGLPAGKVLFSIYNEPDLDMHEWWNIQEQVIAALRARWPGNRIVASASHGGWDLVYFQPYPQRNILYDFHFYEPLALTHYGAGWFWGNGGQGNPNPVYPNPQEGWNRETIAKALIPIIGWKKQTKAQLVCLEFGIYRPHLEAQTRANWLKDASAALNTAHVPTALWEYRGSFGLMDENDHLDRTMTNALGLRHK